MTCLPNSKETSVSRPGCQSPWPQLSERQECPFSSIFLTRISITSFLFFLMTDVNLMTVARAPVGHLAFDVVPESTGLAGVRGRAVHPLALLLVPELAAAPLLLLLVHPRPVPHPYPHVHLLGVGMTPVTTVLPFGLGKPNTMFHLVSW